MKYVLTKDLETGNALIDAEHKKLFQAVNDMMDACSQGHGRASLASTLKFLLDYVQIHFSHEEHLQKRNGYPNMLSHQQFHASYGSKLREIGREITADGPTIAAVNQLNAHIGLLISHIRMEDRRLGAYLRQKE